MANSLLALRGRLVLLVVIGAVVVGCSCVPPVRLAKRTKAPDAHDLDVNLSFIQPGITKRDEVSDKLRPLTTVTKPEMFWGRFYESSWSDPGGGRDWRRKNLIVTYNDRGVVETVRVAEDDEIGRVLTARLSSQSPHAVPNAGTRLQATGVILRPWKYHRAKVVIDTEKFALHDEQDGTTLAVPLSRLKRLGTAKGSDDFFPYQRSAAVELKLTIDDTRGDRRSVELHVGPEELLTWLAFLHQYCPEAKFN